MPTVPSGSRFIGISPSDDVSGKKSQEIEIIAGAYTIEDLAAKIVEIQSTTTTTTASPEQQALILGFNNITSANNLVGDASDVADWNTFFDLPTFGTPFTSVEIEGNTVKLFGATNIEIKGSLFVENSLGLLSINDQSLCVKKINNYAFGNSIIGSAENLESAFFNACADIGEYAFEMCFLLSNIEFNSAQIIRENAFSQCSSIQILDFPEVIEVKDGAFQSMFSISTIKLNKCEILGSTTGDDFIFLGKELGSILLTVPSALMTVNGGNPDGDIQYLQANNTVTITTV